MTNEMAQEPVLMEEFLTESEELLQRMDQDMVLLETHPQDAEILNRIFRALHTIKGTSGFLGFDAIVRLSHQAEDVLNLLRRDEIRVTTAIMDALLESRDQLGVMLGDIRQGGLREYSLDALIAELVRAQKPSGEEPDKAASKAAKVGLGKVAPVKSALAKSSLGKSASPGLKVQPVPVPAVRILEEVASVAAAQPTVEPAATPRAEAVTKASDPQGHTLRVDVGKLDELVNLIGELVLERNRLAQISRDLTSSQEDPRAIAEALSLSTSRLSFITDELQTTGLKTRMVPIETVFRKFPPAGARRSSWPGKGCGADRSRRRHRTR